jgi:putative spermidine/putrescine transport system permease protein
MMRGVVVLCTVSLVVYLLAPLLVIFPVAVTDDRILSLPREAPSLQHFARFLQDEYWLGATFQSLVIGLLSTAIATALAFLIAAWVWLTPGRRSRFVTVLVLMPMITPTIITALGMFRAYVVLGLLDTWAGVVLAHVVVSLPYAFVLCLAGLSTLSPALFRTARSLGAPPLVALWTVVLPANRVAVIAGSAFAFLHSWDELVVTLFVSSRTIQTLPKLMWDGLQDNLDPIIAAVSVLLLVFSTTLLLLAGLRAQIQTQRAPAD